MARRKLNNDKQLAFVPGQPPVSRPKSLASNRSSYFGDSGKPMLSSGNPLLRAGQQLAKDNPELTGRLIQQGVQVVTDTISGVARKFTGDATMSGSHSSGYALSKAPNPSPIQLDSGIRPNTFTSDYMDAKENECSPLHMTSVLMYIPDYATSVLNDWWVKVKAFDFQTKVQDEAGYNIRIDTDFTASKILTALNTSLLALQTYLYYKSIISYCSDGLNTNEGMRYLRNQITPQMMGDLDLLGQALEPIPFPPRMLQMVRYFTGNFFSGPTQGSPIIKIYPAKPSTTGIDTAEIAAATTALTTDANKAVYSLLRRVVPGWVLGVIQDVETNPVYDTNFLTIFANLPFKYYSSTSVNTNFPVVTSDSDTIAYNSYTNALDGAAYALTGMYSTPNAGWFPGLVLVPSGVGTTQGNTRRSFYSVSGVKQMYSVGSYPFLSRSRCETAVINDANSAVLTCHLSGTDRCKSVTILTVSETATQVLDWMLSTDTIKTSTRKAGDKRSGFNTYSASSAKRRK